MSLADLIRGGIKDPRDPPHDLCDCGGGGAGSEDMQGLYQRTGR